MHGLTVLIRQPVCFVHLLILLIIVHIITLLSVQHALIRLPFFTLRKAENLFIILRQHAVASGITVPEIYTYFITHL